MQLTESQVLSGSMWFIFILLEFFFLDTFCANMLHTSHLLCLSSLPYPSDYITIILHKHRAENTQYLITLLFTPKFFTYNYYDREYGNINGHLVITAYDFCQLSKDDNVA